MDRKPLTAPYLLGLVKILRPLAGVSSVYPPRVRGGHPVDFAGVSVVAAAVGVNQEIIQDDADGFLAASEEEWREKTGLLFSGARLREKLGQAGPRAVEERYSLDVHAPRLEIVLRLSAADWLYSILISVLGTQKFS